MDTRWIIVDDRGYLPILTFISSGWCLRRRLENGSGTHRTCQASHSKSGKQVFPGFFEAKACINP